MTDLGIDRMSPEQRLALAREIWASLGDPRALPPDPVLRVDDGGTIRVGCTRIRLDLIVEQYERGMSPAEIVRDYDSLALADVHTVIAYYLRHQADVRAYLTRRAAEAAAMRAKVEAERPRVSREDLLARRAAREAASAIVVFLPFR